MPSLEFFFDCSSPWTYLAFHNVQPMAQELGVAIDWRPILVGGVFNAVNPSVQRSRDLPVPAKDAYVAKDLADWARHSGVAIRWKPTVFPVNSVKAMRACVAAQRQDRLVPLATRLFELYWGDDRDIGQPEAIAEAASDAGLDPDALLREIDEPEVKAALRANTDELIARGGFGSPTIFVGGSDMYFGNDRLALVREALARSRRTG